jgi:hypothetical protein
MGENGRVSERMRRNSDMGVWGEETKKDAPVPPLSPSTNVVNPLGPTPATETIVGVELSGKRSVRVTVTGVAKTEKWISPMLYWYYTGTYGIGLTFRHSPEKEYKKE